MKMISLTSPMSSENVRARFDGPFPMRLCVESFLWGSSLDVFFDGFSFR